MIANVPGMTAIALLWHCRDHKTMPNIFSIPTSDVTLLATSEPTARQLISLPAHAAVLAASPKYDVATSDTPGANVAASEMSTMSA
jgi:hypothetical protein